MEPTVWHKQTKAKPLFPDLLWDKPENKQLAGKLLIIGGNAHSFTAPASAYNESLAAGAGTAKVLLPDVLKKTVGALLDSCDYGPSNKSGSFSKQALSEWLTLSHWADGVILPGDLGRNSETAILLESFITKYTGQLTITQDALDYITSNPAQILNRKHTLLVASFAQLQKISIKTHTSYAFTYDMPLARMVELLHVFTTQFETGLLVLHNGILIAAKDGEVCTSQHTSEPINWRVATAARASVWMLQNPSKTYAALCSAVYEIINLKPSTK